MPAPRRTPASCRIARSILRLLDDLYIAESEIPASTGLSDSDIAENIRLARAALEEQVHRVAVRASRRTYAPRGRPFRAVMPTPRA